MKTDRTFQLSLWLLGIGVALIGVTAWIASTDFASFTSYSLFPLFGILAFSLMWSHYIGGFLVNFFEEPKDSFKTYFTITSILVLALILLHPGIFLLQLWLDGFGLPPFSYLSVYLEVTPRIGLALGSISLLIFLAFEAKRKFGEARWWKYIEYANIAAMFAIFVHALLLGGAVQGWFRVIWILYAVSLAGAVAYNINYDRKVVS